MKIIEYPARAFSEYNSASSNRLSLMKLGKILFVCILIPNIIFMIAGIFIYFDRALINIDYIVLAIVALIFPNIITISLLIAVIVSLDIIASAIPIYFYKLDDLYSVMGNICFLNFTDQRYLATIIIILLSMIAFIYIFLKIIIPIRPSFPILLMLIISVGLLIAIDIINGTNRYSAAFGLPNLSLVDSKIATSPSVRVIRDLYKQVLFNNHPNDGSKGERVAAATGDLLKCMWEHDQHPDIKGRHLVLVIVESLGLSKQTEINRALFRPFFDPKVKALYEVKFGRIPFNGATTSAEFRELCGVKIDFKDLDHVKLPVTLPLYLQSLGFRTLAVHGYKKEFFNRQKWYPQIGFERTLFFKDIIKQIKFRSCGSMFRGICDDDAAAIVQKELLAVPPSERLFLYWLTLNSHLPVAKNSAARSTMKCNECSELFNYDDVQVLLRIIYLVLSKICEVATNPHLPATQFIIVGDHSPPFISKTKRGFFNNSFVPFIEMIPKRHN